MTKTERNTLCGKCHDNQNPFSGKAINPHDRHALFADVGLEGWKQQTPVSTATPATRAARTCW